MTPLAITFLIAFLAALALLVVAVAANDQIQRENKDLRRRVHPSTRPVGRSS